MTEPAAHIGRLVLVKDAHNYGIGWVTHCSCSWESVDLRELGHQAEALTDHLHHIKTMKETTP